jgi:hypothetical protein
MGRRGGGCGAEWRTDVGTMSLMVVSLGVRAAAITVVQLRRRRCSSEAGVARNSTTVTNLAATMPASAHGTAAVRHALWVLLYLAEAAHAVNLLVFIDQRLATVAEAMTRTRASPRPPCPSLCRTLACGILLSAIHASAAGRNWSASAWCARFV